MKTWAMLSAAALALAACGSSGGDEAAKGGNGSASASQSGARGASPSGSGIQPGEWEISAESLNAEGASEDLEAAIAGKSTGRDMEKAFASAMSSVERQCMTPQKAAELFAGDAGEGCKRAGAGWRNGRISTTVTCTQADPPQTSTHVVSGSYSAGSLDVTQRLSEVFDGETVTTAVRTTGRRIGDCPAGKQD